MQVTVTSIDFQHPSRSQVLGNLREGVFIQISGAGYLMQLLLLQIRFAVMGWQERKLRFYRIGLCGCGWPKYRRMYYL